MQYFPRARVLLPGGHNGNQVQDAGLVGPAFQRRQHANVYVHAHGHVHATCMACPNMCSAPVHSMNAWRRGGWPSMFRLPRTCVPLHASHRNGVSGHRGAGFGGRKGRGCPKTHLI